MSPPGEGLTRSGILEGSVIHFQNSTLKTGETSKCFVNDNESNIYSTNSKGHVLQSSRKTLLGTGIKTYRSDHALKSSHFAPSGASTARHRKDEIVLASI